MFTEVPIAAHVVGFVLDDLSNEFDPNSPQFGEKHAPPFLPVSFRDWTGREITRVYTDEWGKYNALLPSTYSVNIPTPSGVSANMLTACINSPTKPTRLTRAGGHRPLLQSAVQPVLLHLPVHAWDDHLPRYAGGAHRGVRGSGPVPVGLRDVRRHADHLYRKPRWRERTVGAHAAGRHRQPTPG
jgi:hypothetical protein